MRTVSTWLDDADKVNEPDRVVLAIDAFGNVTDSWIDGVPVGDEQQLACELDAETFDRIVQTALDASSEASRDADDPRHLEADHFASVAKDRGIE